MSVPDVVAVPGPTSWDDRRCGHLLFGVGYRGGAAQACEGGWPVRVVPGEHLHQAGDPHGMAPALLDLTAAPLA